LYDKLLKAKLIQSSLMKIVLTKIILKTFYSLRPVSSL